MCDVPELGASRRYTKADSGPNATKRPGKVTPKGD
jgi:hypothetical protein